MQGPKTGGAYDWDLDYPSPSMPRVYVLLVDWRVAVAVAALLAKTPDSGGAQAGGVSPPFTVCAHSWFEVCGARAESGGGWGGGRERSE